MFIFLDRNRKINKISTYIVYFFQDQKRGPLNPIGGKPVGGGVRNGIPPIGAK
jgi:hypothetical protein